MLLTFPLRRNLSQTLHVSPMQKEAARRSFYKIQKFPR